MKQFLVDVDDRCARDLERVAPAKNRMRSEFVRLAIRRALDLALDRATEDAYRTQPLLDDGTAEDRRGWDEGNRLARRPSKRRTGGSAARAEGRGAGRHR